MTRYHYASALLLVALLLAATELAVAQSSDASLPRACSCWGVHLPEAFDYADAVFAGTSIAIAPHEEDGLVVTFDVSEVWKGPLHSELSVRTTVDTAACGYPFDVGTVYLVYANLDAESSSDATSGSDGAHGSDAASSFWTSLCHRTQPLSSAEEDLAWLGAGVPVTSEPDAPAPAAPHASLSPNYPNPFRQRTEVAVTLPPATCATLRVYGLGGRLTRGPVQVACAPGVHVVDVELGEVPAGAYVIELRAGEAVRRTVATLVH